MTTVACPNGHQSADPEWCDTCGAPIGGTPAPVETSTPAEPAPDVPRPRAQVECPHCGLSNDSGNLFCEQCGYDFTTGQAPPAPAVESTQPPLDSDVKWVVVVEVDKAWYDLKGSLADQPCPQPSSSTIALTQRETLIGRSSQSRGIHPEIALDADTGVSRRHAQLVRDDDELTAVDLSSTNGTYVVVAGSEPRDDTVALEANVPTPLNDGDRVYVGAWTRLTVRRS